MVADSDSIIGQTDSYYQIVEKLGQRRDVQHGGHALGRYVALKFLPADVALPVERAHGPSGVKNTPPVVGRGAFVSFPRCHGATCWKKTSGCACVSPDRGLCGLLGSVTWFRLSPQTA
jgi:hypothetical protein